MLIVYFIILIACFYLLAIVCDEYFVVALEKISEKMKISSEVAGATLMAIGSSAPELFTSIFALFIIVGANGESGLGAGTIVGSAIFNVLVIIGASLIFTKTQQKLYWQPIVRDLLFYALTVGLLLFFFWDGKVVLMETIILALVYIVYIFVVSKWSKWLNYKIDEKEMVYEVEKETKSYTLNRYTTWCLDRIVPKPEKYFWGAFGVSIVLIGVLSHFMVDSAVHLANGLGVPAAIVGLTILAAGTSVPDLISSIIVAKKNKTDMAVSNALGSNVFDILVGLGFVYLAYFLINGGVEFIPVDTNNLIASIILLFATVAVILAIFVLYKWKTNKWIGWFLIILYLIYLGYNVILVM